MEAYSVSTDYLREDSFYLEGHSLLFKLMGELSNRGIPPDMNAVLDELRSRDLLDKVGGSGVVMGMLNSVPTAANVEYHSKKLAEKATLRNLIKGCTQIIDQAYRQEQPVDEVLDRAERTILGLAEHSAEGEFIGITTVLEQYMDKLSDRDEELKRRREAGETNPQISAGIHTGFPDLDQMTGGMRNSELTIIAARPSVGKTALGLNLAHHIAINEGVPTALFSLEMGVEQLAERMLAMGTMHTDPSTRSLKGVSTTAFQNPDLSSEEWSLLTKSYEKLAGAPIYLDDSSLLTIRMLRSKARRLYSHYGVRLIVVDYLQLMTGSGTVDGRVQEVSEISRGLKLIARELKIPVIALSQLSRQVETRQSKRPMLSDLRESGSIEQDADVVMFIHRPESNMEGPASTGLADRHESTLTDIELILAKNRNGPVGPVYMRFYPELTRFLSSSRSSFRG